MSLEDLNGPILHLVLSLKEGHGFGFLQTPMLVVASTSGLCLETEPIQPCPDPIIRTDFAWETDKKSLRGFRTSNTPVKVECYSVVNDVKRDRLGYILLNIKSAQVVPTGKSTKSIEKCHRLISVPQEAKLLRPELLLSLKIMEANAPVSTCASSCSGLYRAPPESPQSARLQSLAMPLSYDVPLLPIFRPEENFVQIGLEDTCTDIFVLSIRIDKVGNLSLLLPKLTETLSSSAESMQITCTVFNHALTSKPISVESDSLNGSNDIRLSDECLNIKLFSSVPTLFRYFRENPSCTIQLHCNGREIGASELLFQSLLRTDDRMTFVRDFRSVCTKSQRCNWISSFTATVPSALSGRKPFVDVSLRLDVSGNQLNESSDVRYREAEDTFKTQILVSNDYTSISTVNAVSHALETARYENEHFDAHSKATVLKNDPLYTRTSVRSFVVSSYPQEERISIVVPLEERNDRTGIVNPLRTTANQLMTMISDSESSVDHKYCLRVFLTSATFEKLPSCERLRFRFDYPNGQVLISSITDVIKVTRGEPIALADISATIVMHASPSAMVTRLRSSDVRVTVVEVTADPSVTTPFARASLPISCVCSPGKVDSLVSVILEENSSGLQIGSISAHVSLEDCGQPHASSVRSHPDVPDKSTKTASIFSDLPSRADASEMYQVVVELEEWKEKQQEIFEAELKQKEVALLERANEAWLERRHHMEENLARDMAQCRTLAEALSAAREDLCQRSQSCEEKEEQLKRLREELEMQYNLKFQELSLAAKGLDEGVKMKVMLTEARYSDLEDRVKSLVIENEKLRKALQKEKELQKKHSEKSAEYEEKSCGLTPNQVAKLLAQVKQLEEKLQVSMKSKVYLKEQWGRAVREINLSKKPSSRFNPVGSSFEDSEETFSPLRAKGLEQILLQEEEGLRQDSEALELLRRQIGDACKHKIDV